MQPNAIRPLPRVHYGAIYGAVIVAVLGYVFYRVIVTLHNLGTSLTR
jgi:hypothetical protein